MRSLGYGLVAGLLFAGSLAAFMVGAPGENAAVQAAASSEMQVETVNRLLRDMQELAQGGSLTPRQRAEIDSLIGQARLLRRQVSASPDDTLQPRHRRQLERIQLRLDAIKNTLPPRPGRIRKYPIAIARAPVPPPAGGNV